MAELVKEVPRRTALVLYGSETGNAQDLAEELGRITERLHFDTRVSELNSLGLVCELPATFLSMASKDPR